MSIHEDRSEVLLGGVEKVEIRIDEYDLSWVSRYRDHEARISTALSNEALRIEHIGSTAVEGMAAKPIVDVLLVVADSGDEAAYLPKLEVVGYELRVREPDFHEHRMLRTRDRSVHVHVLSAGSPEVARCLALRDALRGSAAERELYAETKRKLAARDWANMNAYADAKSEVIEAILIRAQDILAKPPLHR